jgi:hypothetical protein
MGCACGKGKATASKTEATADQKARQAREAQARANTGYGVPPVQVARAGTGVSQTFALERGGRTQEFSTRLERDAAIARGGGTAH